MPTTGVIAEYNPFHNGHKYHLQETNKKSDITVVAMSQDTVQRGDFSSFDKWWRTKTALQNGADLVIGLPFSVSSQSAEYFAKGSVRLLNTIGINQLSFGTETDLSGLKQYAQSLAFESEDFKEHLKSNLKKGYSFPKSRELALLEMNPELGPNVLNQPNNILAIEYLKAIYRNNYPITPLSINRIGSGYNDTAANSNFMSASGIREQLNNKNFPILKSNIPYSLEDIKKHFTPTDKVLFYKSFVEKILTSDDMALLQIVGMTPDLLNKIRKAVLKAQNIEEFYTLIKSKDLPYSSISRVVLNTLIGFNKELLELYYANDYNPYIRILGFNQKGRKLLKDIDAPLVNNIAKDMKKLSPEQKIILENEIKTANLKNLYQGSHKFNQDYFNKPIITT